jgi:subtilisin family serine protease
MIVRPLQPDALARRPDPGAIRARALARLTEHLIEHVPETDEFIVRVPEGETENTFAQRLLDTGDYEYAHPDWRCFPLQTIPNDAAYWQQWHHIRINSPLAWDHTTGDPSVVIAIVDGGIQTDHPDLAAALLPGYNAPSRTPQAEGGPVDDVDGHGTFVAGLAGAIGNNHTHTVGVGWNFSIMPIRYYDSPGGGFLSDLLNGARWAADHGARVVNVSQTGVDSPSVQTTGAYIRNQGALLVYAAGNDARDLSWFDWPDVLIVGASDVNDQKPDFSAYGLGVDLFAPGVDMLSTHPPSGLGIGSGTSAATPIVSGVAALLWSLTPSASPAQIEQRLLAGCVDLGDPGDDPYWGRGRIDALQAVTSCRVDLSPPVGALDFLDVLVFLAGFEQCAGDADLAPPFGQCDYADILAFLTDFTTGCP